MYLTRTCVLLVAVLGVSSVLADMQPFSSSSKAQSLFTGSVASPMGGNKIVGGTAVNIKDYNYQLSLRVLGSHYCGASLISITWAVTAAHCAGYPVSNMTLVAGSSYMVSGGTILPVAQKYIHPSWNSAKIDYDVALLRMATGFNLSETAGIGVIKLHAAGAAALPAGTQCTISGWGSMVNGGCLPNQLQVVTVPLVQTLQCQLVWFLFGMSITPRMMCAGGTPRGGKGSCKGDSGGPMIATVSGNKTLIGIVSWGLPCGFLYVPDVYTRVSEVRRWINQTSGI